MRERSDLYEEYLRLTKTKKPESGYVCYYKKRFTQLSREHRNLDRKEVNRMVSADWRGLGSTEKEAFEKEAIKVNEDRELN
jgi:hypothetical protein